MRRLPPGWHDVAASRLKIPGAHRVTKKLVKGKVAIYWYRYRGGPLLARFEGEDVRHAEANERTGQQQLLAAFAAPSPAPAPAGKMLSDLIRLFRQSPEGLPSLSTSTRREWTRWLDLICEDLGSLSLKALGSKSAKKVVIAWRDGFRSTPRKADYGIQVLRRLLAFGVDGDLLASNPAEGVKSIYRNDRSDIILDDDELAAILTQATPAARQAIRLAAATGLRRGDLVQLRWSDIRSNRIERPTNKSRGKLVAICPLAGDGAAVIEELRRARQARVDPGEDPGAYVLVTGKGTPWKPDSLTQAFDRAASAAGIKKRLNDLRGTAATRFSRLGFDNARIATFLGWEPARVERIITRYVHAETLAQEAIDRLEGQRATV